MCYLLREKHFVNSDIFLHFSDLLAGNPQSWTYSNVKLGMADYIGEVVKGNIRQTSLPYIWWKKTVKNLIKNYHLSNFNA